MYRHTYIHVPCTHTHAHMYVLSTARFLRMYSILFLVFCSFYFGPHLTVLRLTPGGSPVASPASSVLASRGWASCRRRNVVPVLRTCSWGSIHTLHLSRLPETQTLMSGL